MSEGEVREEAGTGEAGRIAEAEARAATAVERYRDLVASGQGLVPEMVRGSTVEEIDASAEEARKIYDEISRRIVERYERAMPTGNPARSADGRAYEHLKPEAKIAMALRMKTD